jgi:phage-related protein
LEPDTSEFRDDFQDDDYGPFLDGADEYGDPNLDRGGIVKGVNGVNAEEDDEDPVVWQGDEYNEAFAEETEEAAVTGLDQGDGLNAINAEGAEVAAVTGRLDSSSALVGGRITPKRVLGL